MNKTYLSELVYNVDSENFTFQRSGQPTEVDDDQLKAIIDESGQITVHEIAGIKCLGLIKKLDIWVYTQRMNWALSETDQSLVLKSGSCTMNNHGPIVRNHCTLQRKLKCTQKKIMLSVW